MGKYKNCLDICEYFLRKIRDDSGSLKEDKLLLMNNKAVSLNHLGRFSETVKMLESMDEENDLILKNLANAYFQLGNLKEAITLYKRVIEDSGDEESYYNLSACYYLHKDYKAAKFAINSALAINPDK